jgi:hypothetical protein
MKNRFDMEDEITNLYTFSKQCEILSEGILEQDLSKDEIVNALEGMKVMLELNINKLMDTMCQCFHLDSYNNNEEGPNWATQYHE